MQANMNKQTKLKEASWIVTLSVFLQRKTLLCLYQVSELYPLLSQEMIGSALMVNSQRSVWPWNPPQRSSGTPGGKAARSPTLCR